MRERLFVSRHRVWQIVIDAALVSLAFWLAFLLRFDFEIPPPLAARLEEISRPELVHPYFFFTPAMRAMITGGTLVRKEPPWYRD